MKPTHKAMYDFAQAMHTQQIYEQQLGEALSVLGSHVDYIRLARAFDEAYGNFVREFVGDELFSWLEFWMYDCEYGTLSEIFTIKGQDYDPTELTLYKFLEIVDANA